MHPGTALRRLMLSQGIATGSRAYAAQVAVSGLCRHSTVSGTPHRSQCQSRINSRQGRARIVHTEVLEKRRQESQLNIVVPVHNLCPSLVCLRGDAYNVFAVTPPSKKGNSAPKFSNVRLRKKSTL